MSEKTKIEWTDATFNPWWGCTKISPGCDNCYAEEIARRFHPDSWGANGARRVFEGKHWREPLGWNRKAEAAGKPMRVFTGSMCDVFEKHPVAEEYRPELFTLIHKTPWLHWQLLTKRIGNVARMVPKSWMNGHWPSNAWMGATVVNQEEADRDVPKLLQLPASVRFLSCEPLIGRVDLCEAFGMWWNQTMQCFEAAGTKFNCRGVDGRSGIDWVIVGGESGKQARPMHPEWARTLRDTCAAAGVPFLFKQWGEYAPGSKDFSGGIALDFSGRIAGDGYDVRSYPKGSESRDGWTMMHRAGKKAAGRLLDGREHNEFPVLA